MKKLIFATNNAYKAEEIRHILGNRFEILTLKEAGIIKEIPEPHGTIEENAREKSMTIFNMKSADCFSEDTGLEVEALHGAPGVMSARYAGPDNNPAANMELLLNNLKGIKNRKARFRTVISLILDGIEYQFEGICYGRIKETPAGEKGFGYDPVFIPDGSDKTFAQMDLPEKSRYSHRSKATGQLISFLQKNVDFV